jgi:hypothetical protein
MNGFELRGIDAPLIRCDLQPREDRWQRFVDVPALVTADDAPSPESRDQALPLSLSRHQAGRINLVRYRFSPQQKIAELLSALHSSVPFIQGAELRKLAMALPGGISSSQD